MTMQVGDNIKCIENHYEYETLKAGQLFHISEISNEDGQIKITVLYHTYSDRIKNQCAGYVITEDCIHSHFEDKNKRAKRIIEEFKCK